MRWLRHVWLLLTHLEIVMYPPLGRMGVWLCDRYEIQRYRTRVEDTLVAVGPSTQSGPFAPGGTFNIKHIEGHLPPRKAKIPLLRPRHNLVNLIEFADSTNGPYTFKLSPRYPLPDGVASEYRTYPLRVDIPPQVYVKKYLPGHGSYYPSFDVVAVSEGDYETLRKLSEKENTDPDMYSDYLRRMGIRHFVCDWSVIVLNMEAC